MNLLTVYGMMIDERGNLYDCEGEYVHTSGDDASPQPGRRAACMVSRDDVVEWLRARDAMGLAAALANAHTRHEDADATKLAERDAERLDAARRHAVIDAARHFAHVWGGDGLRLESATENLIEAVRDCDAPADALQRAVR